MDLLESMKRDIRITEYAQRCGFTVVKAGTQYSLKEHDSVRIDPEKNLFIRNADRQARGSIIDFVMWIDGVSMQEAVRKLRGQMEYGQGYTPRPSLPRQPPKRAPLELPKATEGKYSRVYAYLNKTRCISNAVIATMMRRKVLYEDERHNCVFVGNGYDGKPAFASMRGTVTGIQYRGDATGSRKEVGFYINNQSPALFVVESPIDAMSIMTMLELNKINPAKYSYLSLGGVSDKALLYHLARPENKGIARIYLATDNDQAGNAARVQLRKALELSGYPGKILDKVPTNKDWNDDLTRMQNPIRQQDNYGQKVPAFSENRNDSVQTERGIDL